MRDFIQQSVEAFSSGSREVKLRLADEVIGNIHRLNGRFLKKRDDGWWEEIEHNDAQAKVVAAFRTCISMTKRGKTEKNQNSQSMYHDSFNLTKRGNRPKILSFCGADD